ncbi:hypothetical protein Tco_0798510 [Tanacetum coccineum]
MDEPEPQSKTVSTIPSSKAVPQTNSVSVTPSSGVMKALVVASGFAFGGVAVLSSLSATVMHGLRFRATDVLGQKRILKRFLDKDRRTLIEETFLLFSGTFPRRYLFLGRFRYVIRHHSGVSVHLRHRPQSKSWIRPG